MRQHLLDLLRWDAEFTDRDFELVDEVAPGWVGQTPVAVLDRGGNLWTTTEHAVLERFEAVPGANGRAHAHQHDRVVDGQRKHRDRSLGRRRPLFEEDVGVGAAKSEATHGGPARPLAFPVRGPAPHHEGRTVEIDGVARCLEIRRGRQNLVAHGEQDLGESRGSGAGEKMTDVGLDRADGALPGFEAVVAPERAQAGELDAVADLGAGGVTLDQLQAARIPARFAVGAVHRAQLAFLAGCEQVAVDVIGRAGAADDRVDRVALRQGVGEALEHEYARTFADDEAVALPIKGRAAP